MVFHVTSFSSVVKQQSISTEAKGKTSSCELCTKVDKAFKVLCVEYPFNLRVR